MWDENPAFFCFRGPIGGFLLKNSRKTRKKWTDEVAFTKHFAYNLKCYKFIKSVFKICYSQGSLEK